MDLEETDMDLEGADDLLGLPFIHPREPPCRLSDLAAQPHKLCLREEKYDGPLSMCFSCKGNKHVKDSKYYYDCATCNLEFHIGCHIFPPVIRHPFHPSHLLTLIILHPDFRFFGVYHDDASLIDGTHGKCKCCRNSLQMAYYHCSICKFSLNVDCARRPPPPTTISHLKSHEHTLTLFPIRLPLPCDACGLSLSDTNDLVYACLPCSRMVHRSCIYLPRVIQITRHPHRLSLTSSLPPGDFSCGVCRRTVDVNYGQYSCNKGCHYAVHSKCATCDDVWDGKDLDGVPEDPEEVIEPFVRIDEETIQHFSHEHYLRLYEKKTICEKDKFCEACTLPIMISQRFYGCIMECDFVLDEACASLPRKKYHPLHKHPLTLHPFPTDHVGSVYIGGSTETSYCIGIFQCDGCLRDGCGFMYHCGEDDCSFQLDVRCASLPDPLIHGCHPHDLFFNLTKGVCMACGSARCSVHFLECIKCNSFLGIRCATLPSEAHYKHDRHPLTLCYGEKEDTTSGQYWCEICESKLGPKKWFYTCDSCRITLHVNCLLGVDIYMKPHYTLEFTNVDYKVEIARSDGNSRRLCFYCNLRCAQVLVFHEIVRYKSFCSLRCVGLYCMNVEQFRNFKSRHLRCPTDFSLGPENQRAAEEAFAQRQGRTHIS